MRCQLRRSEGFASLYGKRSTKTPSLVISFRYRAALSDACSHLVAKMPSDLPSIHLWALPMPGLTRVNGRVPRMVALYTDLSQAPCEVLSLVPACHIRDHSQNWAHPSPLFLAAASYNCLYDSGTLFRVATSRKLSNSTRNL